MPTVENIWKDTHQITNSCYHPRVELESGIYEEKGVGRYISMRSKYSVMDRGARTLEPDCLSSSPRYVT